MEPALGDAVMMMMFGAGHGVDDGDGDDEGEAGGNDKCDGGKGEEKRTRRERRIRELIRSSEICLAI